MDVRVDGEVQDAQHEPRYPDEFAGSRGARQEVIHEQLQPASVRLGSRATAEDLGQQSGEVLACLRVS
jgi:hypothetical protein